ncbi:helix-turn-helix domain-containing protein [Christiangramia gaetbulicola]|nr:RNA-binding domain-containing protein [Christiangramia gaetbulicola]
MKIKQTFKTLTKSTEKLLEFGENETVDYKRDLKGLKSEDLVAFANSENGGIILIGVEEKSNGKTQIGEIYGCDTSDKSRLVIMSKALACIPPISLSIIIENTNKKPIFRLEIPSGIQKPHCTSGGTYKIRKDGRNSVLTPNEILEIYLTKEAKKFNKQFKKATKHLVENIDNVSSTIDFMESTISSKVENISSLLEWTEMSASDTKSTVETIDTYVKTILKEHRNTEIRVKSLIEHNEIKDPVRLRYMSQMAESLVEEYERDEKLFEQALKGEISFEDDSVWKLTDEEKKLIVMKSAEYLYEKRYPGQKFDEEE